VSVRIGHDINQFAGASILAWLEILAQHRFPADRTVTITPDRGGSKANCTRLWETGLQRLADRTGLRITLRHFPPGHSK